MTKRLRSKLLNDKTGPPLSSVMCSSLPLVAHRISARSNSTRRLNTRVVFHSLLDLAGIDVRDPETPRLSVFSPKLMDIRRMVMGEPRPFDFDRWRLEHRVQVPGID